MKKHIYTLILFTQFYSFVYGQGTWVQKANFPGPSRAGCISFSIGPKAYIGLGHTGPTIYNDFWEWDQLTDTWTQKASFPGNARADVAGFSIGTKGYFGTGADSVSMYNDFWEWNQATNVWTQKANFPGNARSMAVGFAIGNKGYIGTGTTGYYSSIRLKDFWQYDPISDTWMQKADFAGMARFSATGFSIGSKGYIGLGNDSTDYWSGYSILTNDFWEWDQATDAWTQKASFAGGNREGAAAFSVFNKGYIGTGSSGPYTTHPDLWEWDPATDAWIQKANYTGSDFLGMTGFSIGNRGYMGLGGNFAGGTLDFWEYTPDGLTGISQAPSGFNNVFEVFPNPSGNTINIRFYSADPFKTSTLTIINFSGQKIYSETFTDPGGCTAKNIDLSQYPKGIYVAEFISDEVHSRKEFIVN